MSRPKTRLPLLIALLLTLLAPLSSVAATLSYSYGTTNTTYNYRPLTITATEDGTTIWQMTLWVPREGYAQTDHSNWLAGEIASFKDVAHGGTAFDYSPEQAGGSPTSYGLMRMSGMQGDFLDGTSFSDHSWQTSGYYQFTKTYTIATGITGVLTVRINAPTVTGNDWRTVIAGSYTVTNTSGATYDLWYTGGTAGQGGLCVEDGGYATWAIVNPTNATAKPNSHLTDTTDGHQLYELYDWYGSTATGTLPGFYAKAVVKDNAQTQALNLRPGLTFELRCDDMSFFYDTRANRTYGGTSVSTALGVQMRLTSGQPDVFGNDVNLPAGESVTLHWEGIISTTPTFIPPVANAGADFEVIDNDDSGDQTVTIDGSASFDPDGSVVSYLWKEGETTLSTTASAQVTLAVGLHTLTLTVTDNDGETDSDTVVISIRGKDGYTYYVDFAAGNDANDGRSKTTPWKHCPGDVNATGIADSTNLAPGDRVIFKGGVVYRGEIQCLWSGAPGNPIVYDGNSAGDFGAGRAVLDASEVLTGWTQCASAAECDGNANYASIYWTYLPAGVTTFSANLYEDDQLLWIAQHPNQPDPFWFDDLDVFLTFDSATDTTITDADYFTMAGADYWDGFTYIIIWAGANQVFPQRVTGYNPTTHTISYESLGVSHYNPGKYTMANSLKILDTPGEYVVREDQTDAGGGAKVYLWPRTAGVAGKTITVSVRQQVVELNDESYVTFRGFLMQKASGGLGGYGGVGSAVRNAATAAHDITLRDNELTRNKSMERQPVLDLSDIDNCQVVGNYIHHNVRSGGMILNECTNSSIRGNTLVKNGGTAIDYYRSHDSEIVGNTVLEHRGVHANGITVYLFSSNILVAYNTVRAGNIAFTGQESNNLTIAYNLLETPDSVYAVALWNDCDTVTFHHNTIRNLGNPGSGISSGSSNTHVVARNNIIDGSSIRYNGGTSEYNIYTSLMWVQNASNLGPGEIRVTDLNTLFVDPAGDYHLKAGSPAIDFGLNLGYTLDLEGYAVPAGAKPDAGAYEYGSIIPHSVTAWAALAAGGTPASPMDEGFIESRPGGLTAFRISLASAADPDTVSRTIIRIVGDVSGNLSSLVRRITLVDATTLEVTLSSPLPDGQWYTLTLTDELELANGSPLTGDLDLRIGLLAGDVNSDGAVTAADLLAVRDEAGHTVTAANARADLDNSGVITGADLLAVRACLGHTLP